MKWRIQKWNSSGVLAIIALLLSIKSLYDLSMNVGGRSQKPVCGQYYGEYVFSIASFLGFVLGYWALRQAAKKWIYLLATQRGETGHRDEWVAVFAMSLAMPAMVVTISSLTDLSFRHNRQFQLGRETAVLQTLRTIHNNQALFQAMKDCFGTLKELSEAGLIDENYVNGQTISGYKYYSSNVTANTYCVRAQRANPTCGDRDFIICEDGDFRYSKSSTVTILKRGEGTLLNGQNNPLPSPMP